MTWSFRRRDEELDEEIRSHLAMAAQDRVDRGDAPEKAALVVRREFGNLASVKQLARELGGAPRIEAALQDVHHAARRIQSRPGTSVLAVGLIGIAIGLTSAMFTVLDALVLRPAPFRHPETLAWAALQNPQDPASGPSSYLPVAVIKAWRGLPGFSAVHAAIPQPVRFGDDEAAESEPGQRVTPGLFEELGVAPIVGRTFIAGEGQAGGEDVALISETVWRSRFAADPDIVNRRVQTVGGQVRIVGVMPSSFAFPVSQTRVWRPLDLDRPLPIAARPGAIAWAYVRLAPGIPRDDVARMATTAARTTAPATASQNVVLRDVTAGHLDEYSVGMVKVIAGTVGLVFLVLCVNVTNVMLLRLTARQREFALCSALGAGRLRLLQQALWEQAIIGMAGTLVGLALGTAIVAIARTSLPTSILWGTLNEIDLDGRALGATAIVAIAAITVAGVIPAWLGTRRHVASDLHRGSRHATPEPGARRITAALLVAEVALAVSLSAVAGIQLQSLLNMLGDDPGVDVERLATFGVTLPASRFVDGRSRYVAVRQLQSSAEAIPAIDGAALSWGVPPSSSFLYATDVVPDIPGAAPRKLFTRSYQVDPGFFDLFALRLIEGRALQAGDPPGTIVVSRTLARTLWPGLSPVGHSMRFDDGRAFRVVGVTNEIRNPALDPRMDEPEMFEPLLTPTSASGDAQQLAPTTVSLTLRCRADCPPLEQLRGQLRSATVAGLTVGAGRRLRDEMAVVFERPRTGAIVAIAFAAIALLAVSIGLFAVLTRWVLDRRREFGIRVALGAAPGALRRLVLRECLLVCVAGTVAGVVLTWALSPWLSAVQYQVQVRDPLTWSLVIVAIAATTLLAAWWPCREAPTVDAMTLLREE